VVPHIFSPSEVTFCWICIDFARTLLRPLMQTTLSAVRFGPFNSFEVPGVRILFLKLSGSFWILPPQTHASIAPGTEPPPFSGQLLLLIIYFIFTLSFRGPCRLGRRRFSILFESRVFCRVDLARGRFGPVPPSAGFSFWSACAGVRTVPSCQRVGVV